MAALFVNYRPIERLLPLLLTVALNQNILLQLVVAFLFFFCSVLPSGRCKTRSPLYLGLPFQLLLSAAVSRNIIHHLIAADFNQKLGAVIFQRKFEVELKWRRKYY